LVASGHWKNSTNGEFFAVFLARHMDKSTDGDFFDAFEIAP